MMNFNRLDSKLLRRMLLIYIAGGLLLANGPALGQSKPVVQTGTLGAGETWETPWRIVDSGIAGPTVLVLGGVHGNEPAGFRAAEQIQNWPIVRGKLVVMPRINRLGLAAKMRWSPDHRNDRELRDLNRNFPTRDRQEALTPHCQAIWEFVESQHPDWVFDLHEGFDFHRQNPKSVGATIISFPSAAPFAEGMLKSVNAETSAERQFELLAGSGPANGSIARACTEQLDSRSFILETSFKDQSISTRTRQHRRMMSTALQKIGLIDQDCVNQLVALSKPERIQVGVFDGPGTSESKLIALFDGEAELDFHHVGPRDMRLEVLGQFEVLVFPGGSGGKQGRAIGDVGREQVREYVRGGGGVIGICAGAYLCSSHYDWSLNLMNASVFNQTFEIPGKGRKSMWYRGPPANVDVDISEEGAKILGIGGLQSIRYHNGPILSRGDRPELPEYTTLALFRSENGIYKQQKNTMIDTPAAVEANYGKGRVLAISPHFESTPGRESVVLHALQYVVGTPPQDVPAK